MCSVLETWLSQERFNTTSSNSRAKSEECNFEIYPKDRHDQNLTGKNNTIWPFYLPWFWFRIQEMNESKLGIEQKSSSSSRWRLWTKISNSCEICRAGRVRRLLLSCFIATAKIYWHQSDSWNEPRLFTVPYFFVRSFRHTASYRHGYLDFQMYRGGGRRGL